MFVFNLANFEFEAVLLFRGKVQPRSGPPMEGACNFGAFSCWGHLECQGRRPVV